MTEFEIAPCDKCGHVPTLTELSGLYYIGCRRCNKLEMALHPKTVVENWNDMNRRRRQFIKARDETLRKQRLDEERATKRYLGGKQALPIYQLDIQGKRVKTFRSASELAAVVGFPKNTIIGKFYRAKNGIIEIFGVRYERDKLKTTPKTNGRRDTGEI